MQLYSYPAGAIVNGRTLTERETLFPLPVQIGEVCHGPAIFERWDINELAALGIKLFIEDFVPQDYTPGTPVDIETETQITRTYPDMRPDEDAQLNALLSAVDLEYSEKLYTVSAAIVTCFANNGEDMDTKLAELRADYQRILAARGAALNALFGEE